MQSLAGRRFIMLQNLLTGEQMGWIIFRFAATLLITTFVIKIFRLTWRLVAADKIHRRFIKNVITVVIWTVGIIWSLNWFPFFENAVAALLAGSGIAAIAIGFAAQESLSNAINGMFISISKPFEVGDRIRFVKADITGFVEDMTLRHTIIRTFTNSRIIIPNTVVNQELIENANFCNHNASSFIDIIITYDSDVAKACEIMAQVIGNHSAFVDTRTPEQIETAPKVPVFVRALGLYGVELRASMWTITIATNFAASSDVRKGILCAFEKEAIRIASLRDINMLPPDSSLLS